MIDCFAKRKQSHTDPGQVKAVFSVMRVCPVYRRKDKREQGETEWESSVKRSVQWRQFCSENWKDKCHEVWCLLERRQASLQGTFLETWTCTCKAWVRPVDPHMSREDLMLLSTRNTHWSCRICLLSEPFTGTTCIAKNNCKLQLGFFFEALWEQMDLRKRIRNNTRRVHISMKRRYWEFKKHFTGIALCGSSISNGSGHNDAKHEEASVL